MGKADELLRTMGGTITESASHRGVPAAMPTAAAASPLKADRLAGVTRATFGYRCGPGRPMGR